MVMGWFIAFIVLLFIELISVNVVTIWFAIGAVAALITTIFTDSVLIQSIVFIVVSAVALVIMKPIMKKFKVFNITPTNSDRVIGKVGEVTKKIDTNEYGEVKIFGNTWTATSDEVIDVGERVKVQSIEGVKLIVKKEEN